MGDSITEGVGVTDIASCRYDNRLTVRCRLSAFTAVKLMTLCLPLNDARHALISERLNAFIEALFFCPLLDISMSGSLIIQNGKLVGAVTHVLINDCTRGYAIFAENMLDTAQSVAEEQELKDAS